MTVLAHAHPLASLSTFTFDRRFSNPTAPLTSVRLPFRVFVPHSLCFVLSWPTVCSMLFVIVIVIFSFVFCSAFCLALYA